MLTATQIEVAQANLRAWEDSGLLPAEITALDALAAYSRVEALLVTTKPVPTRDCVTAADWYDRGRAEAYDELRRALEG
jgi:hypothetical protein